MVIIAFWIVVYALMHGIVVSHWVHGRVLLPFAALSVLVVTAATTSFQFGSMGFAVIGLVAMVVWFSNQLAR